MKRVLVIGSCGAGKSTFARRLHELTELPLLPLDRYYWKPGWVEPANQDWTSTVEKLIAGDEWILDGNYGGTMEMRLKRADTVIWLDMPRYLCLYRVMKRTLSYKTEKRPDMAEGCNERFDFEFMKYVWNFPRDKNPLLEQRIAAHSEKIDRYRLSSRNGIRRFFSSFDIKKSPLVGAN